MKESVDKKPQRFYQMIFWHEELYFVELHKNEENFYVISTKLDML